VTATIHSNLVQDEDTARIWCNVYAIEYLRLFHDNVRRQGLHGSRERTMTVAEEAARYADHAVKAFVETMNARTQAKQAEEPGENDDDEKTS
jgi:hypothetical protein